MHDVRPEGHVWRAGERVSKALQNGAEHRGPARRFGPEACEPRGAVEELLPVGLLAGKRDAGKAACADGAELEVPE